MFGSNDKSASRAQRLQKRAGRVASTGRPKKRQGSLLDAMKGPPAPGKQFTRSEQIAPSLLAEIAQRHQTSQAFHSSAPMAGQQGQNPQHGGQTPQVEKTSLAEKLQASFDHGAEGHRNSDQLLKADPVRKNQNSKASHARTGSEPANHHAASGSAMTDGLIDPVMLFMNMWKRKWLIAGTGFLGAVAGVLIALATPHKFEATNRIYVDPRELQFTENNTQSRPQSTEAMLAVINSQMEIIGSNSVLETVASDLNLDRDPEFNGEATGSGISAGIALIRSLFSSSDGGAERTQLVVQNLAKALSVGRGERTLVIDVSVETLDPAKSALIANRVVDTFLAGEGSADSVLFERTSEDLETRLAELSADLEAAEKAVETFKAKNGIVGVRGQLIDDNQLLSISTQLDKIRADKAEIKARAETASRLRPGDVVAGALPEGIASATLTELRSQFVQDKSRAESLAVSLGPRHPQLLAIQSSLASTEAEIQNELRRIVASSQTDLQRTIEAEQDLASQVAALKAQSLDLSVEFVELRELERRAAATRQIYENFLKRAREFNEQQNLTTKNVRVISAAEPPLTPVGPSRKLIAIGGMITGLMIGIGIALLQSFIASIASFNHRYEFDGEDPSFDGVELENEVNETAKFERDELIRAINALQSNSGRGAQPATTAAPPAPTLDPARSYSAVQQSAVAPTNAVPQQQAFDFNGHPGQQRQDIPQMHVPPMQPTHIAGMAASPIGSGSAHAPTDMNFGQPPLGAVQNGSQQLHAPVIAPQHIASAVTTGAPPSSKPQESDDVARARENIAEYQRVRGSMVELRQRLDAYTQRKTRQRV